MVSRSKAVGLLSTLVVAVLLPQMVIPGTAKESEVEFSGRNICGDLNEDGVSNVTDIVTVLRIGLGLVQPTDKQIALGDLDGDGVVTVNDAITIMRQIVGIIFGQSNCDDRDLIFQDEFSATSLNTSKWTTCYWWDNNGCTIATANELEWYQPHNVSVNNGKLRLTAQEETVTSPDGKTFNYTSGMVTTGRKTSDQSLPPRLAYQYGFVEIRVRVPTGQGLWPAFWLLPQTHISRPEIDVMEILGHASDIAHMNFHFVDADGNRQSAGSSWTGPDFSEDWHIFALGWRPDALIWYVDKKEVWRYEDASNIPSEPMYLLMNLAVGGDWPGAPDESTLFPSHYDIDYVRVWKKREQSVVAWNE